MGLGYCFLKWTFELVSRVANSNGLGMEFLQRIMDLETLDPGMGYSSIEPYDNGVRPTNTLPVVVSNF